MIKPIEIIKLLFLYIFTIDKKVRESNGVTHKLYIHILYRIVMFLFLTFLIYLILNYCLYGGFTIKHIIQSFSLFILIRFLGKDMTDHLIHAIFYKKTYQVPEKTIKQIRKNKLKRIRKKNILKIIQ